MKKERLAFLGPEYTFGHIAAIGVAKRFLPNGFTGHLCKTNSAIIETVASKQLNWGVVPVFNSLADVVIPSLDAICKTWQNGKPIYFYGEIILLIKHHLIGLPSVDLRKIKKIMSHPHAFSQCEQFLREMEPFVRQETTSTAEGVRLVAEEKNPTTAAIGSQAAAEAYGLTILVEGIHSDPSNMTRFMLISNKGDHELTGNDSTWITFTCANTPGSLWKTIAPLAEAGINMHAIHSRATGPNSFRFSIGFDGHRQDPVVKDVLSAMAACTQTLFILGSYPKDVTGGKF
ncbi:MAG: prephenate dehydratase domain-containing protein [Patescibacteria group bacterium]